MVHIALHFFVPVLVALTFYSRRRGKAFRILVATMLIDVDHLLANPIYDPALAIVAWPLPSRADGARRTPSAVRSISAMEAAAAKTG